MGCSMGRWRSYLARYLNVPPARLPGEDGDRLDDLPDTIEDIRAALLSAFDRQRQVDTAARLVARHLTLGHPPERSSRRSRTRCSGRTRASTPIRCWRRACGSSASGAAPIKAGTSWSRWRAPCRPFAHRALGVSDRRHREAAAARRRTPSGNVMPLRHSLPEIDRFRRWSRAWAPEAPDGRNWHR